MADYTDLIARLEKATAPSRRLDAEIIAVIKGGAPEDYEATSWALPRLTESLDAALTLVPEGWSFRLWRHPGEHGCHCDVYLLGEFKDGERPCLAAEDAEQCPTPALALVIAALKARQAGG